MGTKRRDQALLDELELYTKQRILDLDDECFALYGFHLRSVNTFRDPQEQMGNYLKGRDPITLVVVDPGAVVTNAKPGESFHEVRRASDVYPEYGGKVLADQARNEDAWKKMAALAAKHNLTSGVSFKLGPDGKPDLPHLECHWCEKHQAYHNKAKQFNIDGACNVV